MTRAERREKHICVDCNDPATKTQRCDRCAADNRYRSRPFWKKTAKMRVVLRYTRGECLDCKQPAEHKRRRCAVHLAAAVVAQTARRAKRKPVRCACGNPPMTGGTICWCCDQQARRAA